MSELHFGYNQPEFQSSDPVDRPTAEEQPVIQATDPVDVPTAEEQSVPPLTYENTPVPPIEFLDTNPPPLTVPEPVQAVAPTADEFASARRVTAENYMAESKKVLESAANGTAAEKIAAAKDSDELLRQAGFALIEQSNVVVAGECPLERNDKIPANDPGEGFVGIPGALDVITCPTPGCGRLMPSHLSINGQCHIAVRKGVVKNPMNVTQETVKNG